MGVEVAGFRTVKMRVEGERSLGRISMCGGVETGAGRVVVVVLSAVLLVVVDFVVTDFFARVFVMLEI